MEILTSHDLCPIHYVSLGPEQSDPGRTLIFLHGWTADVREWLPFATPLSERFQTLCWDARGHGNHRTDPKTDMSLEAMAEDLHQLIEQRQLVRPVLVGHSMGALTGWEYIRRHGSGNLGGFCIVDQSPKLVTDTGWDQGIYGDFDAERNRRFINRLSEDFAEGVLELVANGFNRRSFENFQRNSPGFQQMRQALRTLPGELLTRCWQSLAAQDYRDLLPRIDIPCLLIYGDQSQFYTQTLARWVAGQIPDSRLKIYANADHSPHLWHREQFIYDLEQFCNSLS
ncbi:MAG: non-heme chloroperoxidase [Motiliproteus sp.]|jgi:non-heme chloroperoxidase